MLRRYIETETVGRGFDAGAVYDESEYDSPATSYVIATRLVHYGPNTRRGLSCLSATIRVICYLASDEWKAPVYLQSLIYNLFFFLQTRHHQA